MEHVASLERATEKVVSAIESTLKTQSRRSLLVALDGRSGTGKSTLADSVAAKLDALVIRGDDFYAGGTLEEWAERTPRQKAELCIDWRRLRAEVLEPLLAGNAAQWRTHNWETGTGLSDTALEAAPAPVIVLDGAYSARPELADLVDLSVLVQGHDHVRRARLLDREGESAMTAWHPTWDEAEDHYFAQLRPPATFDLVVDLD